MSLKMASPTELVRSSMLGSTSGLASSDSKFDGQKLRSGLNFKSRTKKAYASSAHCSIQAPPLAWPRTRLVDEDRKVWDDPKPFSIIGSTGLIGTQTLDIVAKHPDKFNVVALAAGSNVTLLADQVRTFKPKLISVCHASLAAELKDALADFEAKPKIVFGEEGMIEVPQHPEAVSVVMGIVGCAGLKPTVATIEAGKDIALANKETLITGEQGSRQNIIDVNKLPLATSCSTSKQHHDIIGA